MHCDAEAVVTGVALREAAVDPVCTMEAVALAQPLALVAALRVADALQDAVPLTDGEPLTELRVVTVPVLAAEMLTVASVVKLSVEAGELEGEAVGLLSSEPLALKEADFVVQRLAVPEALKLGEREVWALALALRDTDALLVTEAHAEKEGSPLVVGEDAGLPEPRVDSVPVAVLRVLAVPLREVCRDGVGEAQGVGETLTEWDAEAQEDTEGEGEKDFPLLLEPSP